MGGFPNPAAVKMIVEAVSRRPSDMTDAELAALPRGPFVRRRRGITREDWDAGKRGRWIEWEEAPEVRVNPIRPGDIFAWVDANGYVWDFGQWATGQWFKARSVLG